VSWLPNSLTVLRLLLALWLPWAPAEWQFWILLIAGFTDLVDGTIGRALGGTSSFGQVVDPIADKALALSALGTALVHRWITPLEALGVASRDVVVLVLSGWALCLARENWRKMTPRLSGKIATGGQIAALLVLFWLRGPSPVIVWIAAGLSFVSAIDYALCAFRAAP
jgi:phosphatidylglycerophosphate synthase